MVLDEPFSGLTPSTRRSCARPSELKRRGTTVILSTHDMSVAEEMCDFVCMIHRGRKVLDGTLRTCAASTAPAPSASRWRAGRRWQACPGLRSATWALQELHVDGDPHRPQGPPRARAVRRFEEVHPTLKEIFLSKAAAGDPA